VSLYVDSSALLKHYVDEPDRDRFEQIFASDPVRLTGRHSVVEVRRNLARLLAPRDAGAMRAAFAEDLRTLYVVELDAVLCEDAAGVAELTGVRTLDALHLAAARRAGDGVTLLTFDLRQAQAARSLGLAVVGA
jgi:predicted nucleic acid-binding protein